MKRAMKIEFNNGEKPIELILSKATAINSQKEMINFEKLKDGTWCLIYNENLIPDFTKVKCFKIVRED